MTERAQTEPEYPIFDDEWFLDITAPAPARRGPLLASFRSSLADLLPKLRESIEQDDAAQIRSVAHALSGLCLNLGAQRLGQHLGTLSRRASGLSEKAEGMLAVLDRESRELLDHIDALDFADGK